MGTKRVNVRVKESGLILFTGTMIDGAPWMFWHRVIPDGPIDLPPMFLVEVLPDE